MVNYKSLKKIEPDAKHYENLGKDLTNRFNSGIDYVKNSRIGKAAEFVKNEISYSVETNKAALKNPQTRKLWLFNHIPEILTIGYLGAYTVAAANYYTNPVLSDLARTGHAVKGTLLVPWSSAPIPKPSSDGFIHWNDDNMRPLYPLIEDKFVGGAIGIIPAAAKYGYKGAGVIKRALNKENKK